MPTQIVVNIAAPENLDAWGLHPIPGGVWIGGVWPKGTVCAFQNALWLADVQTDDVPGVSAEWIRLLNGATDGGFPAPYTLSVQNSGDTNNSNVGAGNDFHHNLTFPFPAGFLTAARAFRVTAHFRVTTGSAPPNLTHKLKLGSTVIGDSTSMSAGLNMANWQFGVEWLFQATQAPGPDSNVECTVLAARPALVDTFRLSQPAMPVAVATNVAQLLSVATQWSAVGTGTSTITLSQLIVEALNGASTAASPVNTVLPTISGVAQVGQTLTASTGSWTNNPTGFTYQWNRAGSPIAGATASTYVPVAADIGNTLTVSVVATNSGGSSAPATSAPTSQVAASGGALDFSQPANSALIGAVVA